MPKRRRASSAGRVLAPLALVAAVSAAALLVRPEPMPSAAYRRAVGFGSIAATGRARWVRVELDSFYIAREFRPAWTDRRGLARRGRALLATLRATGVEGLEPSAYGVGMIAQRLEALRSSGLAEAERRRLLVETELLLSAGLLALARDLVEGGLEPERAGVEWKIEPETLPPDILGTARAAGPDDALEPLRPRTAQYARLRGALARYREVAEEGGWPALRAPPRLAPGDVSAGVASLRARLAASADPLERALAADAADPRVFDAGLAEALRHFQRRHGLAPDGVLGEATRAALDVPVEERIRTLRLSLDRWRWLPRDLGERAILVNVAGFELELLEDGETRLEMDVVVGKPDWATRLFQAEMDHLVLNPSWHVPASILREEIFPLARADPTYLARHGYEVVGPGTGPLRDVADREEPDPTLRLRQKPGRLNALGRVKFLFPNPYDIYLHDTPETELFERSYRAFSHGCIRVERPLELARYLVGRYSDRRAADVDRLLASGRETRIDLDRPVRVYIVYFTAWTDDEGTVSFYPDVYRHDGRLTRGSLP